MRCPTWTSECPTVLVSDYLGRVDAFPQSATEKVHVFRTRSQAARCIHPLVLAIIEPFDVTPQQFAQLQKTCSSIKNLQQKATTGEIETSRSGSTFTYEVYDDHLYRVCRSSKYQHRVGMKFLVVPSDCRRLVLTLAHESTLSGYFSHKKKKKKN
ncbi:hypothetical protein E2C01_084596 [Portunus trituberculatus]|uniref:Uncharacterized protein n=1 Tax=Portunus trituberculatus TaxID=210409 RepID=A0A5B7J0F5_PORTR|nr:hypothetical protein [Portunus trituberculatus]